MIKCIMRVFRFKEKFQIVMVRIFQKDDNYAIFMLYLCFQAIEDSFVKSILFLLAICLKNNIYIDGHNIYFAPNIF